MTRTENYCLHSEPEQLQHGLPQLPWSSASLCGWRSALGHSAWCTVQECSGTSFLRWTKK